MSTIFVTGPTGVLGRATIPLLVSSGHHVRALSRSEANDAAIRALGAEPVRGSLFDPGSLKSAVAGADAIAHLATHIPPTSEARHLSAWRENDRIRAEGTRNLVDAGIVNGVRVFVYPSFAYVYPDTGDAWIDAATTPADPVEMMRSTLAAEEEVARFATSDPHGARRGVALRLGGLYGASLSSTRDLVALARRGISMFGGSSNAFTPLLWINDAATALVAALERAPSGVYDVVDDEPLTHRELSAQVAHGVGRRSLFSPPSWLLKIVAGPAGIALSRSLRISNRRFKEATGWTPAVPSAREGMALVAQSLPSRAEVRVPVGVRVGLWLLFLVSLLAGLQQQFAPLAFYDGFPGFGRQWVSVDGPYNEHLLRDLGGANLAISLVILFAIFRPSVGLIRAVAAALLVAQIPHFIYHAAHLSLLPTMLDQVAQTVTLVLVLLVSLLVFVGARGIQARDTRSGPLPRATRTDRELAGPLVAPSH